MQDKAVQLRTRRGLSLYSVYGNSTRLVLNGTSSDSMNALQALSWRNARSHKCLINIPLSVLCCILQRKSTYMATSTDN